jgi:hypothetical protein
MATTPYPDWNPADPSASMRRTAEWFLEEGRTTFLKDGTHVELFFLYRQNGQGGMANPPPKVDRDQFLKSLREAIQANDVFGVVHVVEAWVYVPKRHNDHTLKQIMEGELAVSDLKQVDKSEALIVRYECRDGTQRMWINQILRSKTGGVALADAVEMDDEVGGRFGNLF